MLKYMLFSYLVLAVVMLYFANKMLDVRDNLEKKVLGIYAAQFEEIEKAQSQIYEYETLIDSASGTIR